MAANTAELTLILKARNLADTEIAKLKGALSSVAVTAGVVARDMAAAFKGIGRKIGSAMGNIAQDVLSGGSLQQDMLYLGTTAAGAIVEGLMIHFIPGLLARLAATSTFGPIATALSAEGRSLGSVFGAVMATSLGTALSVGLAVVLPIIAVQIGKGLADALPPWLKGAGGLGMSESQTRILNARYQNDRPEKKAAGGWVGLHGPQLAMVGERGPEYVVPNHQLGQSKAVEGVRILGVSEQQILDMVDRGLYFRLQRAAPTPQRT